MLGSTVTVVVWTTLLPSPQIKFTVPRMLTMTGTPSHVHSVAALACGAVNSTNTDAATAADSVMSFIPAASQRIAVTDWRRATVI